MSIYEIKKASRRGEVWAQDDKMQTLVHLNSHNMEAWMVKQLSACCDYGCMLNNDYIRLCKSGNSVKIDPQAYQKQEIITKDG